MARKKRRASADPQGESPPPPPPPPPEPLNFPDASQSDDETTVPPPPPLPPLGLAGDPTAPPAPEPAAGDPLLLSAETPAAADATFPPPDGDVEASDPSSHHPRRRHRNRHHKDRGVPPEEWENTFGPRGQWRYGLCQCFDVCCFTPLCLMSCCGLTHTAVIGQLMERMSLDLCGMYHPESAHNTCQMVAVIWAVYLCCHFLLIGVFLRPFVTIWVLLVMIRVRGAIRARFSIPARCCHCCNGACEDCLVTGCCACCAAIQMARQTHDETQYPYDATSPTGLPTYAPVIFEHFMPPLPEPPMERSEKKEDDNKEGEQTNKEGEEEATNPPEGGEAVKTSLEAAEEGAIVPVVPATGKKA